LFVSLRQKSELETNNLPTPSGAGVPQMKTKIKPENLVSIFVLATLALNIVSPQPIGVSFGSSESYGEEEGREYQLQLPDVAFLEPLGHEFQEYVDHTIVGQTSFVAAKTPPNKKRVVAWRMWLFVTAYSSTPDQTDSTPFITASGTRVRDGIIAANFLPIGTKIRFPTLYGDKIFVVEDRMNKRYYYRADIWMSTRWQAKQFGLRNVPIEIIREV